MPGSFFKGSQPSLEQQIAHGIQLWHEAAREKISNADELFSMIFELMDFDLARKRIAILKQEWAKEGSKPNEQFVIIGTLDSDDPFGSAKNERVISAAEMRESLLSREFPSPCAQANEMLVVTGHRVPIDWPEEKPYPFNGFYISAHYFVESQSLLNEGNEHAAWVSLTRAFYYLGVNSSPMTTAEASGNAARIKHSITKELTLLIVQIAKSFSEKQCGKPIGLKKAAKIISDAIVSDYNQTLRRYSVAHRGKRMVNASDRSLGTTLADQILKWTDSSKSNPHPEVRQAMLPFKSARGRKAVMAEYFEERRWL